MKLKRILKTSFYLVISIFTLVSLQSCSDDDDLGLSGIDCSIVSLNLSSADKTLPVQIFKDSMVVVADYNQALTEMTANFELSEGATVTPDMATIKDWSSPMTFTVISADKNNKKTYSYNIKREAIESYCKDNIYLESQEDVNEFGKHKYARVQSIVVKDTKDNQITDLTPLNSIIKVDNNFTIEGFHGETVALDNLKEVSTLDINSESIHNISARSIEEINNLYIGYISGEINKSRELMDSVANINFESLKKIKGNLWMRFYNGREDFAVHGFDNLESIDGDIVFKYPTANFKTFSKLTKVKNLQVCNIVQSFEGLENIKEVTGEFSTFFLLGIESLLPFAPEKIHTIRLLNNQQLNNFDFCKNLTKLYELEIMGGYKIESLKGLENLREIENGIKIQQTRISNLDALKNLEHVGNFIRIQYNKKLEDFSGLKKCVLNFNGEWDVKGNMVNPTIDEIINN